MEQNSVNREAARYWMIAPMQAEVPELFTAAWEYDRQNGTIAIDRCSDCEMRVGDTVIARHRTKEIIGIGIVKKTPYYDFEKGIERISTSIPIPEEHQKYIKPCFVEVFWVITGSFPVKLKHGKIFREITEDQYQEFLGMLEETFNQKPNLNAHDPTKIKGEVTRQENQLEPNWQWPQQPRSNSSATPNYYVGIDLGTTNSVMAWGSMNQRTNQFEPNIVPINMMTARYGMRKKLLLPSYVYFEENHPPNVGEYAKKMLEVHPERVIESIKHQIGTVEREFEVNGTFYTPRQILAMIFRHLAVSAKSHFGFIPDNAVITVPAYFNTKMREATIGAAKLAGFRTTDNNENPRAILLDEPYAVLYDRINQEIRGKVEAFLTKDKKSKIVLIFDLGGGTLEVSLHKVTYQENLNTPKIEPITRSYNYIGGNKFDESLANYFYEKFKPNLDYFDASQVYSAFRQYAEQAKIGLSQKCEFEKEIGNWDPYKRLDNIIIPPIIQKPVWDKTFIYKGFSLAEYKRIVARFLAPHLNLNDVNRLDIKDFEDDNIIYPILDVLRKVKDGMDNADTSKSKRLKEDWSNFPQVDCVLLNGSMTKLHTIQERLETFFGSNTPLLTNSDGAVARGASIFHYKSEHRGLKSPQRITQEPILIITEAQATRKNSRYYNSTRWYNIYSGANLSENWLKPFYLLPKVEATVEAISAKLFVYILIPNTLAPNQIEEILRERNELLKSQYRKKELHEFQFGRPLKKRDLPLSVFMSINEQGELNVEAHPKNSPNEKFTATVNLEALWQKGFPAPKARYSNIESIVLELNANLRQLKQTKKIDTRRKILDSIEAQGSRILQSPNIEEFIDLLLQEVSSLDNLGKMLLMELLGFLAAKSSDTDSLSKIYDVAQELVSPEKIKSKGQTDFYIVVKIAIETIGKTSLTGAESALFDLLNLDETSTILPTIIHAIGKCCKSIDVIERLKPFIENGEDANRIAAYWALGKIGSREKKEPFPIEEMVPVINIFREQLETDCQDDIKRNCIYALAEICDRRNCASDVVSINTAIEVIRQLIDFLNGQNDDNLSDLVSLKLDHKLQEIVLLAIQMIRGVDLSLDEEKSLKSIREEN